MNWNATRLASDDNVATALQDIAAGDAIVVITPDASIELVALEPIGLCHKIALSDIATGAAVVKYGQCIGVATAPIRRGAWVHVHNLRSRRAQPA